MTAKGASPTALREFMNDRGHPYMTPPEQAAAVKEARAAGVGRWCCFVGCDALAEFSIRQESEVRPDAVDVDACTRHVGDLLGYNVGTSETGGWVVVSIEAAAQEVR